jgi:putative Mn2+ efflux pump MntP
VETIIALTVAALAGVSFGNAWICVLMGFGLTTDERKTGAYFVGGRIIGIILIGMFLALFASTIKISAKQMLLVFGIVSIAFGVYLVFKRQINSLVYHRKEKGASDGCDNNLAENREAVKSGNAWFGLSMGIFRGATPCLKIMLLVPYLVVIAPTNILLAFAMVLVFSLTSTIYPVIGFLSANALNRVFQNRVALKWVGAAVLIGMGVYFIAQYIINPATCGGAINA